MKGTSSIRTWTRLEESSQPLTTKKGRIPACWNNHTGPAGSSVILFAPDPNDQPSIFGRMEYPGDDAGPVVVLAWLRKPAAKFCKT